MDQVEVVNSFLVANKLPALCTGVVKQGCVNIFDLKIDNTFRINKLSSLSKELMLLLKSQSIPDIIFNTGKGLLQIETSTENSVVPNLVDELSSCNFNTDLHNLSILIGSSLKGEPITIDIDKNPHMLIAGSTGSGKSSLLHTIIANLLIKTNADVYIVDTKDVEFSYYTNFSKNMKMCSSYNDFNALLKYLIHVMEQRYEYLKYAKVSHVLELNYIKPIVLIIDEFADLIMQDTENSCYYLLCRLAQKCRAAGIYCILATQRPSADIIKGGIKANFPARLACKVSSKIDSRIILDRNGAEQITNIGGAIINNYKFFFEKFQISYSPINEIFKFLASRTQYATLASGTSLPIYNT